MRTHGHKSGGTVSAEYLCWLSMIARTTNPKVKNYHRYGGRGIFMCDRWREKFENFYEDMGDRPSPGHSLERVDNDQGYSKGNCRWATATEQARNRRSSRFIEYKGEILTLAGWAEKVGVKLGTLHWRLKHWTIERALNG